MIEKFGVPPEKVIEVQALIGDSTDNVPGVPGIGVKTAAQLIGEYGDLETLLARAGEIKQEKRRQALIEQRRQARLSKKLVTLDDQVALDVPLADLAVHEPDYKHLIAFLKAMEFTTLTRRVAEFSGIDAARDRGGRQAQGSGRPRLRRPRQTVAQGQLSPDKRDEQARRRKASESKRPGQRRAAGRRGRALPRRRRSPPRAIAAARNAKVDRSRYEIVRSLERLNAWIARATRARRRRHRHARPRASTRCRRRCAASRSRSPPNEACYVPLAHRAGRRRRQWRPVRRRPSRPTRSTSAPRSRRIKPLLEDPGVLKIGQNLKFDLQIFALRGIEIAPYDDTMLMSYVLDAGRSDHGLDALVEALLRSRHDRFERGRPARENPGSASIASAIEKAAEYAAEDADVDAAAMARCSSRA